MTTQAERITRLETAFEQADGRLAGIEKLFESMERRLEVSEKRVTTLMSMATVGWAVVMAGAIIGAGFI